MRQDDIHEEIRRTLRGFAEKVVEALEGREKMEQMSDETAVEVLEYLTMVYSGILVFLQQHNLEA